MSVSGPAIAFSRAEKTNKNEKEAVSEKRQAEKYRKSGKEAVRSDVNLLRAAAIVHQLFLILWKVDALFS